VADVRIPPGESGGKHPEKHARPSTRELVCDGPFCELLAKDLGLKVTTVRTALIGEPKVRSIRVVEWVVRNAGDDLERRAKILIWWAKKRGAGAFRQDQDAERDIARRIARYWAEHPDRLAETLREANAHRSKPGTT
jgi:hypothetical protein